MIIQFRTQTFKIESIIDQLECLSNIGPIKVNSALALLSMTAEDLRDMQ